MDTYANIRCMTEPIRDLAQDLANGSINRNTIAFVENVTVAGQRLVIEYTGEVVSDNEIRFKRQAIAPPYFTVQFVATRNVEP